MLKRVSRWFKDSLEWWSSLSSRVKENSPSLSIFVGGLPFPREWTSIQLNPILNILLLNSVPAHLSLFPFLSLLTSSLNGSAFSSLIRFPFVPLLIHFIVQLSLFCYVHLLFFFIMLLFLLFLSLSLSFHLTLFFCFFPSLSLLILLFSDSPPQECNLFKSKAPIK